MSTVGQPERATQNRVIALFRDELAYRYFGDWTHRDGNSNIEEGLLSAWLTKSSYAPAQISMALHKLRTEADNHNRKLYYNNTEVYKLLRYGVQVKTEAGEVTETVHLINWREPEQNDFAIAEEVTLKGNHERRPDIVLYVNGIAVSVLELKNSRVSIGHGIRQSLSNQQPEFNAWFFSTVQVIYAGNDSEGLQYGAIGTEEKYFLKWKEDEQDDSRFKLDKYLLKICLATLATMDRLPLRAAGSARPGIVKSLEGELRPDKVATVFAGGDVAAVARVREILSDYPPSSPSMALFQDGKPIYMLHRADSGASRSAFRDDADHDSGMKPISVPTRCRSLIGRFRNRDRDVGIGLRRPPATP